MARWSKQEYEKELRLVFAQAEVVGVEEAVKSFAARLLEDYRPEEVKHHLESLRAKHQIDGDDAQSAFKAHEAHILSRVPFLIRMMWTLSRKVMSGWTTESSPERVVIRTPSSTGRILCPVIRAADGDLEKARPVCEALFRHDAFMEPMSILVAKATSPRIRWELAEYRERSDYPCYYALVV